MGKKLIIRGADFSSNAIGTDEANVNSYIQNGLIIQVDGLSLSGGVWYDLKSNITITNHGVAFGTNGAIFNGTSWCDISDFPSPINQSTFADYTIEAVYTRDADFANNQELLLSSKPNSIISLGFASTGNLGLSTNGNLITGYTGILSHLRGIHYVSANNTRALFDGALLTTRGSASFANGVVNTIGARQKTTAGTIDSPFTGTIHAIRIYNRQLTTDEMAWNYDIDRARFGA